MLQDKEVFKNCGVELIVRCFGEEEGNCSEISFLFDPSSTQGLTLSKVGTGIQRHAYEALRQAYEGLKKQRAKNSS